MAEFVDEKIESAGEKINLVYFSGCGSVWNVNDWRRVLEHRISGRFIGNLPQQCHQVKEMGFPLLLSQNETKYLLDTNNATLSYPKHLAKEPTNEMKTKFQQFRQQSFTQQIKLLKEQRKQEILDKADKIITGKLNKRPRMIDPTSEERESIIQEQLSKIQDPSEAYLLHQISTDECFDGKLEGEPFAWNYPTTPQEKLEYGTFCRLHAMGYWITPGAKFGGQFLVYPGSPLQYHAQFIVRCIINPDNISPLSIVALARVAHSTRKVQVLAFMKPDNEIAFQSVSWLSD